MDAKEITNCLLVDYLIKYHWCMLSVMLPLDISCVGTAIRYNISFINMLNPKV